MSNKCDMCGLCCQLFLINLSEAEYRSGRYKTIFEEFGLTENFVEAKKYGLNLLAQTENGSCIYLVDNTCSIHEWRPKVCRGFFCTSKNKKYKNMREIVEKERHKIK